MILSSKITQLKPSYEVVVIGSGYGGSIAASRMARLGKKVCLLEKGKEFKPGDFPSNLKKAAGETQITTAKGKHTGDETGLYDLIMGENISVVKGCGLGGTSLINANVSIEPEKRVFDDEKWPKALRDNLDAFYEGVAQARHMLQPTTYPEGKNGYPVLAKTAAMRKSAAFMEKKFKLLDINVNFEDKINHVGMEQKKCNNCGDCVSGCNNGSKNTTYMNYLPDAKNHGAEIFTEVGVRYLKRVGDKWLIYFDAHNLGREKFDGAPLFITADVVILGAGSLGSTEILLRSAEKGLPISDLLGQRFTGNGDVLAFGYNNDVRINGIGKGDRHSDPKLKPVGPCITSVIDIREEKVLEDGMVIEEGSAPGPVGAIFKTFLVPFSRILGKDTDRGFGDFLREKGREIVSFFRGAFHGAVANTQVFLVMTHDDGKGEMGLKKDRISIKWPEVGSQSIFQKVSENLKKATQALGGNFIKNPMWIKLTGFDLVTVHPLGGCVMGDDAETGVVDHKGQVFAGKKGKELHPNLYVMDGAIVPRPLGVNPLLTISGLAERNCKIIAEEMGLKLNYGFPEVKPRTPVASTVGIQFTETMKGFFAKGNADYKEAHDQGKKEDSPFKFLLTILTTDLQKFIDDPDHLADMAGTVTAPALSASPLLVSKGKFNLFVSDKKDPGKKEMKYNMLLHSEEGKTYCFTGFKDIQDDRGLDMWADTTKLYITVHEGKTTAGPVVGKGILKIKVSDFSSQLMTIKAINAKSKVEGLGAAAKFGKLFAGNLWETYF